MTNRLKNILSEGILDSGCKTILIDRVLLINNGCISFLFSIFSFLSDFFMIGLPLLLLGVTNSHDLG